MIQKPDLRLTSSMRLPSAIRTLAAAVRHIPVGQRRQMQRGSNMAAWKCVAAIRRCPSWLEVSKASDAAARLRVAGNEVAAHRIGYTYEYDRNGARLSQQRPAAGVELPTRTSGCNATSSLANSCASSGLAGAKR